MRLNRAEKFALAGAIVIILTITTCSLSRADEPTCPPATPCKVVTVTPQEEASLTAPNGILDMATWASRPLGDFANQWREKLRTAPAGKAATPPTSNPPGSSAPPRP